MKNIVNKIKESPFAIALFGVATAVTLTGVCIYATARYKTAENPQKQEQTQNQNQKEEDSNENNYNPSHPLHPLNPISPFNPASPYRQ